MADNDRLCYNYLSKLCQSAVKQPDRYFNAYMIIFKVDFEMRLVLNFFVWLSGINIVNN